MKEMKRYEIEIFLYLRFNIVDVAKTKVKTQILSLAFNNIT